jgi:transposase-like protein
MHRHRRHTTEFEREVVQAHLDGETLYDLAKQHHIDRSLIRLWVRKYECGEFEAEIEAAKTLHMSMRPRSRSSSARLAS